MHRSRLCALLIDCKTSDVDEAASFWTKALGRSVDLNHWGSRGNYRMLETLPDEPIVQISARSIMRAVCIWISRPTISLPKLRALRSCARMSWTAWIAGW